MHRLKARRDISVLKEMKAVLTKREDLLTTSSTLKESPLKVLRRITHDSSLRETTGNPTTTGEIVETVLDTTVMTERRDTIRMIVSKGQIVVISVVEISTTGHRGTTIEAIGGTIEDREGTNVGDREITETTEEASRRGTEERDVSKTAEAIKATSLTTSQGIPTMTSPGSNSSARIPRETKDPETPRRDIPLNLPNPIPMYRSGSPKTKSSHPGSLHPERQAMVSLPPVLRSLTCRVSGREMKVLVVRVVEVVAGLEDDDHVYPCRVQLCPSFSKVINMGDNRVVYSFYF